MSDRVDAGTVIAISVHLLCTPSIRIHSRLNQRRLFAVCYVDSIAGIGKDHLSKRFGSTPAGKMRGPVKSAAADTEKKSKIQSEWHRMTRMTRPDCAVMCNLINTHTHTQTEREREGPLDASKCLGAKQVSARLGLFSARTGSLRLVKKASWYRHFVYSTLPCTLNNELLCNK